MVSAKAEFKWTDEHDRQFAFLKERISERCINYHPDFNDPFYLASDVCKDGFGSILYQVKSYATSDLASLKAIELENANPTSTISTEHPILPSSAKGVPPALDLRKIGLLKEEVDLLRCNKIHKSDLLPTKEKTVHVVRPIGFHSSMFENAAKNYTILEKETAGLLKAIKCFQQYYL